MKWKLASFVACSAIAVVTLDRQRCPVTVDQNLPTTQDGCYMTVEKAARIITRATGSCSSR